MQTRAARPGRTSRPGWPAPGPASTSGAWRQLTADNPSCAPSRSPAAGCPHLLRSPRPRQQRGLAGGHQRPVRALTCGHRGQLGQRLRRREREPGRDLRRQHRGHAAMTRERRQGRGRAPYRRRWSPGRTARRAAARWRSRGGRLGGPEDLTSRAQNASGRPGRLPSPTNQMAGGAVQDSPGSQAQPHDFPAQARRPSTTAQAAMPSATTPSSHMSVYTVIEVIGSSATWWEDAAAQAIKTAGETLHDLRVAEVVKQDIHLEDAGSITCRTMPLISSSSGGRPPTAARPCRTATRSCGRRRRCAPHRSGTQVPPRRAPHRAGTAAGRPSAPFAPAAPGQPARMVPPPAVPPWWPRPGIHLGRPGSMGRAGKRPPDGPGADHASHMPAGRQHELDRAAVQVRHPVGDCRGHT